MPDEGCDGCGPEEEGEAVEIPDIELVVEGAGKGHTHQIGGQQNP